MSITYHYAPKLSSSDRVSDTRIGDTSESLDLNVLDI